MRTGSQFLGPLPVIAFVLSSCAYDQALLGDPEREEMTEPIYVAESNDEFVAIDDYEGLPTDEPVEFEPSEQDGIITPADSLDMFDDLSFHGSWYWLDPHGWVWRPIVARRRAEIGGFLTLSISLHHDHQAARLLFRA